MSYNYGQLMVCLSDVASQTLLSKRHFLNASSGNCSGMELLMETVSSWLKFQHFSYKDINELTLSILMASNTLMLSVKNIQKQYAVVKGNLVTNNSKDGQPEWSISRRLEVKAASGKDLFFKRAKRHQVTLLENWFSWTRHFIRSRNLLVGALIST